MFVRHFSDIFIRCTKLNSFILSQIKPFLNNGTRIFPLKRSIPSVRISTSVGVSETKNIPKEDFVNKSLIYLLNNKDKFYIVDTDNINLDDTVFKSLKLLKYIVDNSEATENPEELISYLREDFWSYCLEDVFRFIILLSQVKNPPKELFTEFDGVLRRKKFSLEDRLKILFVMRKTGVWGKCLPQFLTFSMIKLSSKMSELDPYKAVQMFFFMKKLPPSFTQMLKFSIQHNTSKIIPSINAVELGIVASGLSRLEIPFSVLSLPTAILSKATAEAKNIDALSMNKISGVLEPMLRVAGGEALLYFQKKILPHFSKYDPMSLISLALAGSRIKCINSDFWNALAMYFKENSSIFSTSDIERIVFATTVYNIQDKEILNLAIRHFESKEDIQKEVHLLLSLLISLIHHKLYPENLLGAIFTKNFTSIINQDGFSWKKMANYGFINHSLEIEMPNHNFTLIKMGDQNKKLLKAYKIEEYHHSDKTYRYLKIVSSILEKFYGKNSVKETGCLPHIQKGILMKFDKSLKAQPLDKSLISLNSTEVLTDEHSWVFIIVVSVNEYLYQTETPTLPLQTKIRHLKMMGYKPVVLKTTDVWNVSKSKGILKDAIRQVLTETSQEL